MVLVIYVHTEWKTPAGELQLQRETVDHTIHRIVYSQNTMHDNARQRQSHEFLQFLADNFNSVLPQDWSTKHYTAGRL